MKQLFNWLGKKSEFQPTLGYLVLSPFIKPKPVNEAIYNLFKLKNGGRAAERVIFLTTCFAAAAALPTAMPIATAILIGGTAAIAAKTVGVLAGKVTDLLIWDVNARIIPRREEKMAKQKQPSL